MKLKVFDNIVCEDLSLVFILLYDLTVGTGIQVTISGEEAATCRVKVLCVTLDLPAKAKVSNFVQFDGRFGCTVCKEEGLMVKVGRVHTCVYKYMEPLALRNHKECFTFGRQALQEEEVCTMHMKLCRMVFCFT